MRTKSRYHDPEWEAAETADEEPKLYWCYTDVLHGKPRGEYPKFVHSYKPSLAEVVRKRTGWYMEEIAWSIRSERREE